MSRIHNMIAMSLMMASIAHESNSLYFSRGFTKNNDVYGGLKKIKHNKKKKRKKKGGKK